ncbi:Target SNARE coiled-coil homology domain [Phytophthora cactorum]|nr:Target SNARE coiled-coil homology domain [Phytophthora cactorum]
MDAQQQFDQRRADDQARQDALLDQIHGGAHAINGEVVEQNIMIDDIGDRMDNATRDISREEQAAREACKLYGIIAVLVVILIIVFVIPSPN